MNPQSPADADDARRLISALADGEADPGESARGISAWADGSSEARRSWHAYHLIGDVLRSEDLASAPARDQVFLERLRLRLADEPVVTVPRALTPPVDIGVERAKRKARWLWPAALAASVMALATVLVSTLGPIGGADSSVPLAAAPATVVATRAEAQPPVLQASGLGSRVVRDAQLDRYLRAHRDYGTALPGSLPGGPGRSISTVSLDR